MADCVAADTSIDDVRHLVGLFCAQDVVYESYITESELLGIVALLDIGDAVSDKKERMLFHSVRGWLQTATNEHKHTRNFEENHARGGVVLGLISRATGKCLGAIHKARRG